MMKITNLEERKGILPMVPEVSVHGWFTVSLRAVMRLLTVVRESTATSGFLGNEQGPHILFKDTES